MWHTPPQPAVRRMRSATLRRITCIALGITISGAAYSEEAATRASKRQQSADEAAFQAVCGSCHRTSMVDGLRTEAEWIEEVQQMIKIGAKGTDEQFDSVFRVLLRTLTKININRAEPAEIVSVLQVSEATAQALVDYRTRRGDFKTVEELKKVASADSTKLEARRNRITF